MRKKTCGPESWYLFLFCLQDPWGPGGSRTEAGESPSTRSPTHTLQVLNLSSAMLAAGRTPPVPWNCRSTSPLLLGVVTLSIPTTLTQSRLVTLTYSVESSCVPARFLLPVSFLNASSLLDSFATFLWRYPRILFPPGVTEWTSWFNIDHPGGNGDYERLEAIRFYYRERVCARPISMEARTTDWVAAADTGEVVHSSLDKGFWCINKEQPYGRACSNYHVRFQCPPGRSADARHPLCICVYIYILDKLC